MIGRVGASRLSLVGGILVVIVGIVHTIATPMVHQGLSGAIGDKALGLAYFFAAMGVYVVLAGWLMIFCSRGLARGERWAWLISVVNGGANAVGGVGAVAVGFTNPFVWTWLLASAVIAVGVLLSSPAFRASVA